MSNPAAHRRRQAVLLLVFGVALAAAVAFGARAVMRTVHWSESSGRTRQIEGWMTPGFIARTWGVDRATVARALDIVATPGRPRTLAQIAQEKGTTVEELAAAMRAVLPDTPPDPRPTLR